MKLVEQFTTFLRETVNLNQNRIKLLEQNSEAIKCFLKERSAWEPKICQFIEQGSWAHDTIIRPVDGNEFDADLLVVVDPVEGWMAKDYITTLGKVFSNSKIYNDKVKVWDYCVTVTYKGERKVDIAPCVANRKYIGQIEVCNRNKNIFEESKPFEYTQWMKERNSLSGNNSFRKATRLLKYLRDIKGVFTCSSVLLTTLLGMQIKESDKGTPNFSDTPTALCTLIRRLDTWLQSRPRKPCIANPVLRSEDFAKTWTDAQYSNFRNCIKRYREWVDTAYNEKEKTASINAWRKVFGNAFAKNETVTAENLKFPTDRVPVRQHFLSSTPEDIGELINKIRNYGISILPKSFYNLPYMHSPPWPEAIIFNNVQVLANWQNNRNAPKYFPIKSGEILQAQGGLWFDILVNGHPLLQEGLQTQWRITNTGPVARSQNACRGGFYVAQPASHRRWEELLYRGVHIAEAFIIRNSDDTLVGQSLPFSVVIE